MSQILELDESIANLKVIHVAGTKGKVDEVLSFGADSLPMFEL